MFVVIYYEKYFLVGSWLFFGWFVESVSFLVDRWGSCCYDFFEMFWVVLFFDLLVSEMLLNDFLFSDWLIFVVLWGWGCLELWLSLE